MLSTMRKRVRVIMIVVAATFILGFLASELWRLIGERGGQSGRAQTYDSVGKVGKHAISPEEFRNALAYITNKYRQENQLRDLSNEDYAAIEQQTWRYLVTELTWAKVLRDANIRVSQDEILEIMKANPPEGLRGNPELYTDGKFDAQKYEQVMSNPANRPLFQKYFQDLVEMLPKEKFRIDVMSAYRVTGAEAQDYALARNTRWVVTSLYFGPQSLTEKVEPSDAEVKEYFEEHRDEYAVKETRQVRYVAFGVSVSAQDSQAAAEAILRAHAQLVAGESFNLTMLDFSDLEADTSGALYARSRLDPGTDSIVKKLKPGTYSAPFLTTYGWQVVMLDSARTDSVALRRILVRVKGSGEALAAMRDSARVFAEKAVAGSFDTVALQYGLAVTPTRPMVGGELSLANMGIEGADQLLDWVRRAKPGSTFEKPLRGQQGFMVFGVGEVKPAGYQEFEKVKPGVSWKVRQAKEKALWMAKAGDALAQIRAGKSFEQYAQENPAVQLQTDSLAGSEDAQRRKGPEFAGVVQALAAGDKCGVLETNWGAFVLRCDERSEIQPPPVTAEAWTGQRQQQIGQQLMQTFLKEEGVKDYREGGY